MPKSEFIETETDKRVKSFLLEGKSFSVIAGAGSGKTTSLVSALDFIRSQFGERLRSDDKRVVCVTYTKRAVQVISERLERDELFLVSTLHSFLWSHVRQFRSSIVAALRDEIIPRQIEKKNGEAAGKGKAAQAAKERIESLKGDLALIDGVGAFRYNETNFSSYGEGLLGHDDIIDVSAHAILHNPNLQRILRQKYPFIFVDEAQDTFVNIVQALNKLCENDGLPLVGYFGDPMQQIYEKRAGSFAGPIGAVELTKVENYRCSPEVIALLNSFRGDVKQVAAGKNASVKGSVGITLVAAEAPLGDRKRYTEEQSMRASQTFDKALEAWGWHEKNGVKQLFLVRQMIARRLGFSKIHQLFTGEFASTRAKDDYETGEHFLLKPFVAFICDLIKSKRSDDRRELLRLLRIHSPAFDPTGENATKKLGEMMTAAGTITQRLEDIWGNGTVQEVLQFCAENKLISVSKRLEGHLSRKPRGEKYDASTHEADKEDWLVDAVFAMTTEELEPFADFVRENTALSTQHGVKGEEYKNVVVVFDDVDAAWNNYSFTKTLTPATSGSPTDGQLEKSRKLAYVCFSRAEENLRVLLFTPDPSMAAKELVQRGLFQESQITFLS